MGKRFIVEKQNGKPRPLSAQDFAKLTREEKAELCSQVGSDYEEYEKLMEKLTPKKVDMPPIKWRKR